MRKKNFLVLEATCCPVDLEENVLLEVISGEYLRLGNAEEILTPLDPFPLAIRLKVI